MDFKQGMALLDGHIHCMLRSSNKSLDGGAQGAWRALCRFQQLRDGEGVSEEEVEARLARIPAGTWGKLYRWVSDAVAIICLSCTHWCAMDCQDSVAF